MSKDFYSGAVNMHKRIASGEPAAETHLKKGGAVKKFANGGIAESAVAKLPAKGSPIKADFNAGRAKIATMKKGGMAKQPGIMIAIAMPKKAAGRGR